MNVNRTASPPQNSPQSQGKTDPDRIVERKFDEHLFGAKNKLDLYSVEDAKLDKEEIYWEEVEKKRERNSIYKKYQTDLAAQMVFLRNFENDLATEAEQFKNLWETRAVQEKVEGEKIHLRTPAIITAEKGGQTTESFSHIMDGELPTKLAKNGSPDSNTPLSMPSDRGPVLSANEIADTANPFRPDIGKSPINQVASQAATGRSQNLTQFQNQPEGSFAGKGHSKFTDGKGNVSSSSVSSVSGIQKFDSILQKKTIAGNSSRNQVEIKEIAGKIKLMISAKKSEIIMRLTPEHLGKLEFRLKKEGDQMTGLLKVDNNSVRELLGARVADLRQALENQGIYIEDFTIVVREDQSNGHSGAFAGEDHQNRNSGESGTQNAFSKEESSEGLASEHREIIDQTENGTNIYV